MRGAVIVELAFFLSVEGFTRILSKYFESSFIAGDYGDRGGAKQALPAKERQNDT
jgi:hypothetical protein